MSNDNLTITIHSFSYKQVRDIPQNSEGGGFIFDCRCLPNPGREEIFKCKNGLDEDVKQFLEKRSEVEEYYKLVQAIVDQAVNAYLSRKFSNLSIGFGCTGGQHRSVYLSERLAAHLKSFPNTNVQITHLNKNNWVRAGK